MARLPQPGADQGQWGAILNEYLSQSHNADGSLQDASIPAAAFIDDSIAESKLSTAVQSKLNAVASGGVASVNGRAGVVTLTKTDVSLTNVDNTSDATKPVSTATQSALDTKAALSHVHSASQISDATAVGRSVLTSVDAAAVRTAIGAGTSNLTLGTTNSTAKAGDYTPTKTDVGLSNVDNTSDTNKPISSAAQTALNAKEPAVTAGTTTQYYRGDKTWQTLPSSAVTSVNSQTGAVVLAKADIGLTNIDNTSDATKNAAATTLTNKTISGASNTISNIAQSSVTNLTTDLAAKATDTAVVHTTGTETVAGVKTFSSSPIVPTPTTGTQAANKTYVDGVVAGGAADATTGSKGIIQLAGDLGGTATSPAVSKINGVAVSGTPATGDVLTASSGTAATWTAPSGGGSVTSVAGRTGAVVLTKTDVSLSNVDNTSDASKPVSTAQQTALNAKADTSAVGAKLLLIDNAAALPAGTPAGVVVVVKA